MSQSQLDIQRRLTTAFIATRPVTVVLRPRNRVKTPTGGFVWQDAVARPPQVMRFCEPSTQLQEMPNPTTAQDGVVREVQFMLLGEWDSVIGTDDVFDHEGQSYQIVQVAVPNGWEQRASVVRYG
jgi:hypothetical protein